jgi:hypothetical protein
MSTVLELAGRLPAGRPDEARYIDDGCLAFERESSHRLQATENISDLHLCTIVSNETIVNLRELLVPA